LGGNPGFEATVRDGTAIAMVRESPPLTRVIGGSVFEALLALLLAERTGVDLAPQTAPSPEAQAIRAEIQARLAANNPKT
jgi:hypothetical protein